MTKKEKEIIIEDLKKKIPTDGLLEISVDDGPVTNSTFLNIKPTWADDFCKGKENPLYNLLARYGKESKSGTRGLSVRASYGGTVNGFTPHNGFNLVLDDDNDRVLLVYVKLISEYGAAHRWGDFIAFTYSPEPEIFSEKTVVGYWSIKSIMEEIEKRYKPTLYAHVDTRYVDEGLQYKVKSFSRSRAMFYQDFITLLCSYKICYRIKCSDNGVKKSSEQCWAFTNKGAKYLESMIYSDIDLTA